MELVAALQDFFWKNRSWKYYKIFGCFGFIPWLFLKKFSVPEAAKQRLLQQKSAKMGFNISRLLAEFPFPMNYNTRENINSGKKWKNLLIISWCFKSSKTESQCLWFRSRMTTGRKLVKSKYGKQFSIHRYCRILDFFCQILSSNNLW